jgi:hypothetical protein
VAELADALADSLADSLAITALINLIHNKSIGNLTTVLAPEEVRVGAVGVGCSKVRGGFCSRLVAKQSPSGAHQPMIAGQ